MKTFRNILVVIGTAVTGLLVWRKVEADRLRNDLWAEAEKVDAHYESPTVQTSPVAEPVAKA